MEKDEKELLDLQHRDIGDHSVSIAPRELASGWVIECSCGWNNEIDPATDADAAREQHQAHVELIRRHERANPSTTQSKATS